MVLRGAAGFTLGMPFLFSLLGKSEEARAQALGHPKQFVAYGTCDGGLWQEFMYPGDAVLKDSMSAPAGHSVRRGRFNDIIVAAFACGTSRIATLSTGDASTEYSFSDYTGDWHGDIAHGAFDEGATQADRNDKEKLLVAAGRTFFEGVFLDLASKLDAVDVGDGTTLLDNSLLQWTQEAGSETHTQIEMAVVTAGSAGKFFQIGNYLDYRQKVVTSQNGKPSPGILYNQYLGNVLQAMGLAPTEFNVDGNGGYGRLHMGDASWYPRYKAYKDSAVKALNDLLPYLT